MAQSGSGSRWRAAAVPFRAHTNSTFLPLYRDGHRWHPRAFESKIIPGARFLRSHEKSQRRGAQRKLQLTNIEVYVRAAPKQHHTWRGRGFRRASSASCQRYGAQESHCLQGVPGSSIPTRIPLSADMSLQSVSTVPNYRFMPRDLSAAIHPPFIGQHARIASRCKSQYWRHVLFSCYVYLLISEPGLGSKDHQTSLSTTLMTIRYSAYFISAGRESTYMPELHGRIGSTNAGGMTS